LTNIGSRLPRQGIARTLVNPTAPMPSFKNLPPKKFNAVVAFLAQLK
jgi:ubiquinol-cytochrome c reductase cytochrome b subunit/menaquinol-cytochrome c reductase cytochrome b/c subunit